VELMTEISAPFHQKYLGSNSRECGHDTDYLKENFTIWVDKTEQSIQLVQIFQIFQPINGTSHEGTSHHFREAVALKALRPSQADDGDVATPVVVSG